ncbi:Acetyl esterase/lipase [Saccharopolyspora antimicrobica]|uniref:Acetyl esterase/lipase n=1 Tax=Saccharopolyspora antimicrobica TaxID=455193 RepID=A0A1I4SMD6_9PSEU|nr:alpha/beta hydrolase fold domain-containing protein [Saccharopolyspora antimicrobica]RKT87802.1 acetyl esterase/lipase [Saccharopolyspora antimicrobica]SFM65594.1 Acetyl esterase/lipase [Saccharopolyspora antimicrobica]
MTPVPYDPELEPGLAAFLELVEQVPLRAETILANRAHFDSIVPPVEAAIGDRPVDFEHVTAPGVELTVLRPRGGISGAPGICSIHGGGMVLGNRAFGAAGLVDDVLRFGAVAVTVEYRLAPEHPAPAAAEDCYAGLCWFAEHAGELGVDPARILVGGSSAGGGLSAAVALMARDRGGPALVGQLLDCPMLDDRNETVSSRQYDGIGAWDRNNNDTAWNAILGSRRGTDAVSPYAAPARANDLSGLPPAFISVGAAEVFRDEAIDYATRIWATGGRAELHVWSGGYHGFAGSAPHAEVSRAAMAARDSWLRRVFG